MVHFTSAAWNVRVISPADDVCVYTLSTLSRLIGEDEEKLV